MWIMFSFQLVCVHLQEILIFLEFQLKILKPHTFYDWLFSFYYKVYTLTNTFVTAWPHSPQSEGYNNLLKIIKLIIKIIRKKELHKLLFFYFVNAIDTFIDMLTRPLNNCLLTEQSTRHSKKETAYYLHF